MTHIPRILTALALGLAVAGCGSSCNPPAPVDAGSSGDAASEAGETDASLLDSGAFIDAPSSVDSGEDAGRDDAGLPADAGACAPPRACGVAAPFTPKVFCSEAVRECWASCATPACDGRCAALMASEDCYYCYLSRSINCMIDWCPAEWVSADCCDSRRCSSCEAKDPPLDACFERNWAPNCRETYYDSCFAP